MRWAVAARQNAHKTVAPLTNGQISSYKRGMVRRRAGELLGIEVAILHAGLEWQRGESGPFHGFAIARLVQEQQDARRLTAHGTLYKALARMERDGLLSSSWEDPDRAADEGRPRRRLYEVTGAGEVALAQALRGQQSHGAPRLAES